MKRLMLSYPVYCFTRVRLHWDEQCGVKFVGRKEGSKEGKKKSFSNRGTAEKSKQRENSHGDVNAR